MSLYLLSFIEPFNWHTNNTHENIFFLIWFPMGVLQRFSEKIPSRYKIVDYEKQDLSQDIYIQ